MACRVDRIEWRDATSRSGAAAGDYRPCRGSQPRMSLVGVDATMGRLSLALAPADEHVVNAGILDRLREHHFLPPVPPAVST